MSVRRVVPSEAKEVRADLRALQGELNRGDRVKFGDTGREVEALQRDLKRMGFFKYPEITGNFGPITREALKDFQRAKDLPATGVLNQDTLDALKANHVFVPDDKFSEPARRGQSGKDILGVERKLAALGFDPGTVDGVFTKNTLKAVRGLRKQDPQLADDVNVIDKAFLRELDKTIPRSDRVIAGFAKDEPNHDYRRVSFRGATMNKRTEEMLKRAEFIMRHEHGHKGFKFEVTQGSYNASVGASAGTHDGGGALDIRTRDFSKGKVDDMVKAMRQAGFAAWSRGRGFDTFSPHIHAIALGDRQLSGRGASFGAFDQIPDYARGQNGLSNHARDPDRHLGRPVPQWAKKYL